MYKYIKTTFLFSPIGLTLASIVLLSIFYTKNIQYIGVIGVIFFIVGIIRSKSFLGILVIILIFLGAYLRITSFKSIDNFVTTEPRLHKVSGFIKDVSDDRIEITYVSINEKLVNGRVYIKFEENPQVNFKNLNKLELTFLGEIKTYRKENLSLNVIKVVDIKVKSNPLSKTVNFMIERVDNITSKYFDQNSAILKAMVFGIGDDIEKEDETLFRNLGLSHVLVASGANILMIINAISYLTSKLKFSRLIEFIIIFIYTLIVGIQGSIIRAFFFFCVNMISRLIGRDIDYFQKILLSTVLIAFIFPYMIFGLSFQLSLLATLSIQFSSQLLDYFKVKNKFLSNLLTNVFVLIIVNILISNRFHTFNLTGLVSNILVLFIVEWIVLYGFGYIALSIIFQTLNIILLERFVSLFANPLSLLLNIFLYSTNLINNLLGNNLNLYFYINFNLLKFLYILILYIWFFISYKKWKTNKYFTK